MPLPSEIAGLPRPALASLALAAALAACTGSSTLEPPAGTPYVRGPVESVASRAAAARLLVRAGPGSREPCGISASADAGTRYLRRTPAGELEGAGLSDVQVGDTVEVYVEGPVAESCPVQARASAVVLVSEAAP